MAVIYEATAAAPLRAYGGSELLAELVGNLPEIRYLEAPPGELIDRLVIEVAGTPNYEPQYAHLKAVRKAPAVQRQAQGPSQPQP